MSEVKPHQRELILIVKALGGNALVIVLCLIGLAAAVITYPKILLVGLAGFCVLAAAALNTGFIIAMLWPKPKK